MEMKKYIDIERVKESYKAAFKVGEHIVVTEKVDGANASIRYDSETDSIICFSRKKKLNSENNLRGFFEFVQTLDKDIIKESTENGRYIIFGEWLVKHSIKYPEEVMNKFYVFDVFDTETNEFVSWFIVKEIADKIGLILVPLIYDGEFTSWDDLNHFVGKTALNAIPCGEGIVIKSQDRLDNKYSETPAYVKIVSSGMSEVQEQNKSAKAKKQDSDSAKYIEIVSTIVTEPRVRKILNKFIDDGIIPIDFDEKSFGLIAKTVPKEVYEDCLKEEPETVELVENFGKYCTKVTMSIIKNLIIS